MKLSTSNVAVKRISSKIPRSTFSNEKLDRSAQLFLEAEGTINPIVLRQTDINSYEIIEGDFEYYAAARAREIDPRKGEMIAAYILDKENEKAILEQIDLLRKSKTTRSDVTITSSTEAPSSDRIDNLEARQESIFKEIKQEIKQGHKDNQKYVEQKLNEFADKMPKTINVLETFNEANAIDLADRLVNAGMPKGTADKISAIVVKERKKKKFDSLNDVVNRVKVKHGKRKQKGISEIRMLNIVDSWSKISVNS